jgi:hypothetical protein
MPAEEATNFRERRRKKAKIQISFEGGPDRLAVIQIRGGSSRKGPKKSFDVQLEYLQSFQAVALDRFYLLNLLDDPHHFEMLFSYRLLSELDLFPCFYHVVRLFMNDEDEGLYLLVERPKDAIRRVWPDVVMIARPRLGEVDVVYARPRSEPLQLIHQLDNIQAEMREKGDVEALANVIDLEGYLTWLAFNSLVENGDSRNEFHYFELTPNVDGRSRLKIAAWDYDNLQAPPVRPNEVLNDPLLYACEMPLDQWVQSEPSLYSRYKRVLRRLLTEILTAEKLRSSLNEVRAELDDIDIAYSNRVQTHDQMRRHQEMNRFEERLLRRRQSLLEGLERE